MRAIHVGKLQGCMEYYVDGDGRLVQYHNLVLNALILFMTVKSYTDIDHIGSTVTKPW